MFGEVTPPSGPITVARLTGGLTNLVFWARHPNLQGQTLTPGTKEAAEWSKILKDEVTSALHNSSTQYRIGQLIFFSRHPNILGHFKQQPQAQQQTLWNEFLDIRNNIVQPWLALQIARGTVNSRTIFVVDNDVFRGLPWETRTRAGDEIASQFDFVNGTAKITVMFLDPARFPEEFNFSDAVITVTDLPPNVHVDTALRQQVNNLNRAMGALGSRQRIPAPAPIRLSVDRYGLAIMNKFVTPATAGPQVAVPLMASAVDLNDLIKYLNEEYIPEVFHKGRSTKDEIPTDKARWTGPQREMVGIALGRAIAHEVRHLYVRNPDHAADGLGSAGYRLFGQNTIAFSAADRTSIQSSITALEGQQGNRNVAASYAAAERALDFPF